MYYSVIVQSLQSVIQIMGGNDTKIIFMFFLLSIYLGSQEYLSL